MEYSKDPATQAVFEAARERTLTRHPLNGPAPKAKKLSIPAYAKRLQMPFEQKRAELAAMLADPTTVRYFVTCDIEEAKAAA